MRTWLVVLVALGTLGGGAPAQDHPHPTLALDPQDHPWAAWVGEGPLPVGRVTHWTGTAWVPVGTALHHDPQHGVTSISLALGPDGTPWVAWGERPAGIDGASAGGIHVARWVQGAWQEAAPLSRTGQPGAESPLVRIDARGKVWVLWSEVPPGSKVEALGLAAWTDPGWTQIDDPVLVGPLRLALRSRDLALDPAGNPVLVVSDQAPGHGIQLFVHRWNGERFAPVGGGLNVNPEAWAGFPSLALDPQGTPTVAFVEAADHLKLVVKRWSGDQWRLQGTPGSLGLQTPKLALSATGGAVVVAVESLVGVTVRQRSSAGWVDLGSDVSGPGAEDPSVAMDSQGNPWVLWVETHQGARRLGLKQWLGTKWQTWPTPEISAANPEAR